MSSRTLVSLFVLVIAGAAGVLLWWLPEREEAARPAPVAAFVGIEVAGSGEARIGLQEIGAGTPFRLHAVLQAEAKDGSSVWYTEAGSVVLPDGTVVSGETVRPWDQPSIAQVLWFSVEGNVPYLPLAGDAKLERFGLQEFSRPEWGRAWAVAGSLETHGADQIEGFDAQRQFGTQRYQVWIEISKERGAIVPDQRLKSSGPEEVLAKGSDFPAVVATLPAPAALPSSVFGLTQIEPPEQPDAELTARITELWEADIAFSRLALLRDTLAGRGLSYEALEWRLVDLSAGLAFEDFQAGDLLRVGSRWVFLHADEGTPGVLDSQDLCLDFDAGAVVRPLAEVFQAAEGGGDIEWARL
ncbi:MAG: hypothetical protein AAF690_05645 [Acidobacteriota bacterium]